MAGQWRAQFDAEVSFANGGGLRAEGFRLDIPGEDIGDEELGALFVRHLGLLLVDRIYIANKTLVREAHKGSRGVNVDDGARTPGRVVELSHVIHPGSPGPESTDQPRPEASRPVYGPGTEFHIGRISMVANWRPVRFVVADAQGREIDLHPLVFAPDGSATQASTDPRCPFIYPAASFVTGEIQSRTVPCLSAEQQVYFHQGYEPTDRDRHDMAQLRQAFGIATHF
jgi:hypothetical protein